MPVKVMSPVAAAGLPPEEVKLGPMVLMSGFMTKKTRSRKRWKQRWWQLMDNGFLYYFKSDDHPQKTLGKIDVGKTCYEVKLGAELCHVKFPRAVPSCCCFCFAVVNRTYYVYTPTPDEAQTWAQAINDLAQVINRKVVAGLERRKAPSIPGMCGRFSGNMQVSVTRVRLKGSQSFISDSCQDISQVHHLPIENNKLLGSKSSMASSVPSYLDKIGNQERRKSQMSAYVSSEMLQEQQPEIVTMEEMQASRNDGYHSSLPYFVREQPLPGNIQPPPGNIQQISQQQTNHQKQQINELEQQGSHRHRSHSLEDICSPKPVAKPRKAKATRNSLDKEKNFLECHAPKTSDTEMIEVRPAPPFSSPPPSHLLPLTTCPYDLPRPRKNCTSFPFSPPSSPPPPPPSQQNNVCESTVPSHPLSSPPSSRPKKNIRALTDSMVPSRPAKPFLPPRPITETDTAPFSSPPRPRKKTITRIRTRSTHQDSGFTIKPKPKPRSKNHS